MQQPPEIKIELRRWGGAVSYIVVTYGGIVIASETWHRTRRQRLATIKRLLKWWGESS